MSAALATLSERHKLATSELNKARDRIAAILPMGCGLGPGRAIAVCVDALARNPKLLDCTPSSIVRSVIAASEVGLELGSPHGEAYIVPFNNRRKGVSEATMMIGYRGFVRLIRGAPRVTIVHSILVREADTFDIDYGNNKLTHRVPQGSSERERGQVKYAYARVYYEGNVQQFEVMDRDALEKIRRSSKDSRAEAPWSTNTDEMYKKCPLRRMAKWLDLTQQARRAAELDAFEATMRGEISGLQQEGFEKGRADDLKDMFKKQNVADAEIIEGEIEEP